MATASIAHTQAPSLQPVSIRAVLKRIGARFGKWIGEAAACADDSNSIGARGM